MRLIPKTHKARNLLKALKARMPDWDGEWSIMLCVDHVNFSAQMGPWWFVAPIDFEGTPNMQEAWWVHAATDHHFSIEH